MESDDDDSSIGLIVFFFDRDRFLIRSLSIVFKNLLKVLKFFK